MNRETTALPCYSLVVHGIQCEETSQLRRYVRQRRAIQRRDVPQLECIDSSTVREAAEYASLVNNRTDNFSAMRAPTGG